MRRRIAEERPGLDEGAQLVPICVVGKDVLLHDGRRGHGATIALPLADCAPWLEALLDAAPGTENRSSIDRPSNHDDDDHTGQARHAAHPAIRHPLVRAPRGRNEIARQTRSDALEYAGSEHAE